MRIFSQSTPHFSMSYPVSLQTRQQDSLHQGGTGSTIQRFTRSRSQFPYGQQATRSLHQKASEGLMMTFVVGYSVHLRMTGTTLHEFCVLFSCVPSKLTMHLQRPPGHPYPQNCFQSRRLPLLSLGGGDGDSPGPQNRVSPWRNPCSRW